MIEEAINTIVELERKAAGHELTRVLKGAYSGAAVEYEARVKTTDNGRELGEIITPFRPAKLSVSTLTGFIDAIEAGIDDVAGRTIIHVDDFETVSLKTAATDIYGVRDTLLVAKYAKPGAFLFDQYQPGETFLIGLETCFLRLDGDDSEYVKALASNLKAGDTVHSQDDGVSQTVDLRMGQIETKEAKVKARVKLTPIRTFAEAAPVEGEFLFRLKGTGQLPLVSLFTLGGTKWQGECMLSIKKYLSEHNKFSLPILA
jgi:hypothetical protein